MCRASTRFARKMGEGDALEAARIRNAMETY